jgi:hypothetical protein
MGKWGYDYLGMFRSQADIDGYVQQYKITKVFDTNVSELKPGMLYYRDVRGNLKTDGTYEAPDGIIDDKDMVRLSKKSGNPYGFSLNLGGDWKGISFTALIGASWGGFSEVPSSAKYISANQADYMNVPKFWNDMFTLPTLDASGAEIAGTGNVEAKYPNMYWSAFNNVTSSFWQVNSFRMTLRSMTVGYSLPKRTVQQIGIGDCRFTLTGMNLLSFYNPLPGKFMDINSNYGAFPNLRNISLGINLSF